MRWRTRTGCRSRSPPRSARSSRSVAMNRYPVPARSELRALIREVMQVPAGCDVLLGNGSDELHPVHHRRGGARGRGGDGAGAYVRDVLDVRAVLPAALRRRRACATISRSTRTPSSQRWRGTSRRWSASPIRTTRPAMLFPDADIERIIARRAGPGGDRRGLPRLRGGDLHAAARRVREPGGDAHRVQARPRRASGWATSAAGRSGSRRSTRCARRTTSTC